MTMKSRTSVNFPEWVEKYRKPGRTIKKTKNGYALYQCTSRYEAGKSPRSVQTYLGVIKKDEGFIPKRNIPATSTFIEYGLSHLIWKNLRAKIAGSVWHANADLIKLGIIGFIFGSVDESYLRNSFLTYAEADRLVKTLEQTNPKRIQTVKGIVEKELHKALPDESDYDHVTKLLMLYVVEICLGCERRPVLPESLREILEKNKLKFD